MKSKPAFTSRSLNVRSILFATAVVVVALLSVAEGVVGQVTLAVTEDAYVESNSTGVNFGTSPTLKVKYTTSPTRIQRTYLKFSLASLPPGTGPGSIRRAILKLYTTSATLTPGTVFNAQPLCAAWSELTITYSSGPTTACGNNTSYANDTWVIGQFAAIDITPIVKDWVSGRYQNNGIHLSVNPSNDVSLASRESGSNIPVIDVDLHISSVNGTGGLTGGGTSSDIALSIADGGVTTPKLADGAVTTEKLADASVTSAKIANASVGNNQLGVNYAASGSKGGSAFLADDATKFGGRIPSEYALVTALGGYVSKMGDTMTGGLNLPANGLNVGGNQFVFSGGNIGIGKTNPAFKLDVSGDVLANSFRLSSGSISNLSNNLFLQGTNQDAPGGATGAYLSLARAGFNYPGGTAKLSAGATSSDYNSTPGAYITLEGNDYASGGNIMIASGHAYGQTSTPGGDITLNASGAWGGHHPPYGNILFQIAGTEYFRVKHDGNVGIRKADPTEALEVVGNIKASGNFIGNSFSGSGAGLTNVSASSLSCTACVTGAQVGFNFAGSASQGGPATSALTANNSQMLGGVAPSGYAPAAGSPNYAPAGQYVNSINGISGSVTLAAGSNISIAQSGNTVTVSSNASTFNPLQVAQLRWYGANLSGASFAVGNQPFAAAFDGGHIWVSNAADNTVSKLRASDGQNLGTFSVGSNPRMVAFDGKHIWVANFGSNSVSKLSATDGSPVHTFTGIGNGPWGLAFDGTHMWVAFYASNSVVKIRASDNQIVGSVTVNSPLGLAFDGTNIWAAQNSSTGQAARISGTGTPTVLGQSAAGVFPGFIAFDGSSIWVSNSGSGDLTKLNAADGSFQGTFQGGGVNNAGATVFDGKNLWVIGGSLLKMNPSNGQVLASYPVTGQFIAFDGANLWVTNFGNTVTKH